jgi:hypothetical protein
MERIPETATLAAPVTNNYFVKEHKLFAESVINKALWTVLVFLVLSVLITFFVEDLPGFVFDIRNMAIEGIWIMVCCYSIGEVVKRIFRNKGKSTEEYKKARTAAQEALASLTMEELAERQEYCTWYENQVYNTERTRLLDKIGMTEEEYKEKYDLRSRRELKKIYKDMPKKQLDTLGEICKLERIEYDASFFLSTSHMRNGGSPSSMYNSDREDKKNSITSMGTSVLSGICAVTFAGDLILSFSLAVLFSAIVKITITAIFASFKANFGWNLSMLTDIGHFTMQEKEVANLKAWYIQNKKQKE